MVPKHFSGAVCYGLGIVPFKHEDRVRVSATLPIFNGMLAHLGERRICNAEAVGAEPTRSTKFSTVVEHI